jgi:hypothetical protein
MLTDTPVGRFKGGQVWKRFGLDCDGTWWGAPGEAKEFTAGLTPGNAPKPWRPPAWILERFVQSGELPD